MRLPFLIVGFSFLASACSTTYAGRHDDHDYYEPVPQYEEPQTVVHEHHDTVVYDNDTVIYDNDTVVYDHDDCADTTHNHPRHRPHRDVVHRPAKKRHVIKTKTKTRTKTRVVERPRTKTKTKTVRPRAERPNKTKTERPRTERPKEKTRAHHPPKREPVTKRPTKTVNKNQPGASRYARPSPGEEAR